VVLPLGFLGVPWWNFGVYCALLAYTGLVMGYSFIAAAPEMCPATKPVRWHRTIFAWCQGSVDPHVTVARTFSAGWVFFFGGSLVLLLPPVLDRRPRPD